MKKKQIRLQTWLKIYEQSLQTRNYKPQTLKNKRTILNHIYRLFGKTRINKLRAFQITQALQEFLPLHSSTAKRVLQELKEIYSEAIANRYVKQNPALYVKSPKHKVIRQRLSWDTFLLMLEASKNLPPWVECLLLLALFTGQRRGDLVKMSFTDIEDNCLQIEQQKQAGKGYGARIAIPLDLSVESLHLSLKDVLDKCKQYYSLGKTLLRKQNGGPLEVSSLSARFHECFLLVNKNTYAVYECPSLHEIRSLSARIFSSIGINTQILLGHKNAEMTELYKDERGLNKMQYRRVEFI